jgi:hypothetical protein
MSKRLEILQNSLEKKNKEFDQKLSEHFKTVKSANGQPLNDKRNGHATMRKWDNQNEALLTLKKGIEKTERAIEKEKERLAWKKYGESTIPSFLKPFIQDGTLKQWVKHPNRYFFEGVEKVRLIWDEKKGKLNFSHHTHIPTDDQFEIFKKVMNDKVIPAWQAWKNTPKEAV